jgi:flagellar basal-body rod protein FlgB
MKNFLVILITLTITMIKSEHSLAAEHITLLKTADKVNKKYKTNDLFKSYLELSSFKHKVLSQNLANINTPRYKADDVEMPTNYDNIAGDQKLNHKINMARTSDKHIAGSPGTESKFSSHKLKDPYETKMNGNNVSLAQQTTKLSQNKNDYLASVKAYSTTNALFSSVLGK